MRGARTPTTVALSLLLLALAPALSLALSGHGSSGASAARHLLLEEPAHDRLAFLKAWLPGSTSRQPTPLPLSEGRLEELGLDAQPTVWKGIPGGDELLAAKPLLKDFNLEQSRIFARLVSAAYCSNSTVIQAWQCTRCQRVPSFKVHRVVFDTAWTLLAYVGYHPELDAIVAVFRGTDNHQWSNWIENLRSWQHQQMWPLPNMPPSARVHAGFYNLWTKSSMQVNITKAIEELLQLHPSASLYVTGHSMGAALAELCALDAKSKFNIQHVHAYTFGSPRVGNVGFQQLFESQVDSSWRFTHNRDVVPSLPPTLLGYHHVAREVWTLDVASPLPDGSPPDLKLLMCDGSGEDPSCHNSACLLGLCTSVMDHLTYLQYEMYRRESEC